MEKQKICAHLSINYSNSNSSSLHLVSLFELSTGNYIFSMMSNDKESLIKQIEQFAKLNDRQLAHLRKIII